MAARNVTDAHVMDARNVTDAHVMDAVRDIAWTTDQHGRSKLTPEGYTGAGREAPTCVAQRIVAWHAAMTKQTDLVMVPLRMAIWQRGREGGREPGACILRSKVHRVSGATGQVPRIVGHVELSLPS